MIPKVINYCWFGRTSKPEQVLNCIRSWERNCPDFTIKEWNEDNLDITDCKYAMEAYEHGKWAFVSDYARIKILYLHGGVYCDTDVEIINSISDLLNQEAFIGFEKSLKGGYLVNSGSMMGASPGNAFLKELESEYRKLSFLDALSHNMTCVEYTTNLMISYGLIPNNVKQIVAGITVYPVDYFSTRDMKTGKIVLTKNSRSIHYYDGSWAEPTIIYGHHLKWFMIEKHGRTLGMLIYAIKYSIYIIRNDGIVVYLNKFVSKAKEIL